MLPGGVSWGVPERVLGEAWGALWEVSGESQEDLRGGIVEAKNAPDLSETLAMFILPHFLQ